MSEEYWYEVMKGAGMTALEYPATFVICDNHFNLSFTRTSCKLFSHLQIVFYIILCVPIESRAVCEFWYFGKDLLST